MSEREGTSSGEQSADTIPVNLISTLNNGPRVLPSRVLGLSLSSAGSDSLRALLERSASSQNECDVHGRAFAYVGTTVGVARTHTASHVRGDRQEAP